MSKVLKRRLSHALRGLVVGTLAALTVVVVKPAALFGGEGDCDERCLTTFGACKECTLPGWEEYSAVYSHCMGSSCYYACGALCEWEG